MNSETYKKFDIGDAIGKAKEAAGKVGEAVDKLSPDDQKKLQEHMHVNAPEEAKKAVKNVIRGHLETIKTIGESPEGKIVAKLSGDSVESKVDMVLKVIDSILSNPLMA